MTSMKTLTLQKVKHSLVLFALFFLLGISTSYAQDDLEISEVPESPVTLKADIVSRYVWRGQSLGGFSVQPSFEFFNSGFIAGTWGSISIDRPQPLQETDFYIGYAFGDILSIIVNDYFVYDETQLYHNFFQYSDTSMHQTEAILTFNGTENIPFSLTATMFFGGADFKNSDGSRVYSSYLEAAYNFGTGKTEYSLFAGAGLNSPDDNSLGYYGNEGFEFVNVGLSVGRSLTVSDRFEIPMDAKLVINPATERAMLVLALTLNAK